MGNKRQHPEDNLHKQIAKYLADCEMAKVFGRSGFWTYMPFGEKRTALTGALLKSKGTKRGVPDFMILVRLDNSTEIIWIEAKSEKGKQELEQIEFETKTKNQINEYYYIVKSTNDIFEIFKKLELIKE